MNIQDLKPRQAKKTSFKSLNLEFRLEYGHNLIYYMDYEGKQIHRNF